MNEMCYDCMLPVTTVTDVHDQDDLAGLMKHNDKFPQFIHFI